jgi:hypothetical protein
MFVTEARFLSPLSSFQCGPGQQSWLVGELALHRPWFLVTLLESDPDDADCLCQRTFFTSSLPQVEAWAKQTTTSQLQFDSAMIVTPSNKNGTSTWQMEALDSIWSADEPTSPDYPLEVCQTQSGSRYVVSITGTPPGQLVNYKLSYQFPKQISVASGKGGFS